MITRHLVCLLITGMSVVVAISGCNGKNNKVDYMAKARQASAENKFQLAKAYIDSVKVQEPKNYELIRQSRVLLHEIEFAEQKRTCTYCDSLLKVRQAEFPLYQKNFTFCQNKEYGQSGYYVNINQQNSKNHNRTYLQARIEEDGKLTVTSYYCGGAKIGHTRVRIYSPDGSFMETQDVPRDGSINYAFSDEEYNYEMVRFNEKRMNGILEFVRLHADESLKVELIGNKNTKYPFESRDKQAILGAMELSTVLSDIHRLLDEIRIAQAKMNYLSSKKSVQETDSI